MCMSMSTPKVPKPRPRPKTDETDKAANAARNSAADQRGVFGTIFTSLLGDPGYGSNVQK